MLICSGCTSLPSDKNRKPSYALAHTEETKLAKLLAPLIAANPGKSGFNVLELGQDALVARVALIQSAQRSLDLQYYIWHDDLTGRLLHNRLLDAADRGVRVRLLLDDMDTAGKEITLFALDAHPNIEIRLYNPFKHRNLRAADFLVRPFRVNHRMHNKALIADNQAVILGGRNIGDEYFSVSSDVAFDDVDVLAMGGVVKDVSNSFDQYWNSPWVYSLAAFVPSKYKAEQELEDFRQLSTIYRQEAQASKFSESLKHTRILQYANINELPIIWSRWFFIGDDPGKLEADSVTTDSYLGPNLKKAFDMVSKDLLIISPYFVPGEQINDYLIAKAKQGVRIRILTNSLAATDVAMVHAGYMGYRKSLLEAGVELYEFRVKQTAKEKRQYGWIGSSQSSLHAKSFLFDESFIFVGSFNLDPRSIALNTELGVYFAGAEFASLFSREFDENIISVAYKLELVDGDIIWRTFEQGTMESYNKEPDTGWWKRFTTGFMSFIVPESLL